MLSASKPKGLTTSSSSSSVVATTTLKPDTKKDGILDTTKKSSIDDTEKKKTTTLKEKVDDLPRETKVDDLPRETSEIKLPPRVSPKIRSFIVKPKLYKMSRDEMVQYYLTNYRKENGDQCPPNWDRFRISLADEISKKYRSYEKSDYEFYREVLKKCA